jgi:hypothetical protein
VKRQKIVGILAQIQTDPTQYKPYSPLIMFDRVRVEFEVPDGEVTPDADGGCTLTIEGLMVILSQFADAMQDMHFDRQHTK